MNTLKILKDICDYYSSKACSGCLLERTNLKRQKYCLLKENAAQWADDELVKICESWDQEWTTLGEILTFLVPGVVQFKADGHCPTLLDPQWDCGLPEYDTCEKCWERFLGQRIHKSVIKDFLSTPRE